MFVAFPNAISPYTPNIRNWRVAREDFSQRDLDFIADPANNWTLAEVPGFYPGDSITHNNGANVELVRKDHTRRVHHRANISDHGDTQHTLVTDGIACNLACKPDADEEIIALANSHKRAGFIAAAQDAIARRFIAVAGDDNADALGDAAAVLGEYFVVELGALDSLNRQTHRAAAVAALSDSDEFAVEFGANRQPDIEEMKDRLGSLAVELKDSWADITFTSLAAARVHIVGADGAVVETLDSLSAGGSVAIPLSKFAGGQQARFSPPGSLGFLAASSSSVSGPAVSAAGIPAGKAVKFGATATTAAGALTDEAALLSSQPAAVFARVVDAVGVQEAG